MESRKKQTSNRPTWERILANARSESPPDIDVRPGVRAVLEAELRSGFASNDQSAIGLLEGILELFSRPTAKYGLSAVAVSVFAFTVVVAALTDTAAIDELGLAADEIGPEVDESYVMQDWTEVL